MVEPPCPALAAGSAAARRVRSSAAAEPDGLNNYFIPRDLGHPLWRSGRPLLLAIARRLGWVAGPPFRAPAGPLPASKNTWTTVPVGNVCTTLAVVVSTSAVASRTSTSVGCGGGRWPTRFASELASSLVDLA